MHFISLYFRQFVRANYTEKSTKGEDSYNNDETLKMIYERQIVGSTFQTYILSLVGLFNALRHRFDEPEEPDEKSRSEKTITQEL